MSFADKWARKKVEESIKEYVKGIWKKANIEWVVGGVNFAVEKMSVPIDEIRGMISKTESTATSDGKIRIAELRKRLGI